MTPKGTGVMETGLIRAVLDAGALVLPHSSGPLIFKTRLAVASP